MILRERRGKRLKNSLILVVCVAWGVAAAGLAHAGEAPGFAAYATESLRLGHRTVIRGGAAGAFGLSPDDGLVEIQGGRVVDGVYGQTVVLGPSAKAKHVFAHELVDRGGSFKELAPLPEGLPAIAPPPNPTPHGEDLLIPDGETSHLGPDIRRVDVGERATLIIDGGEHRIESLRVGYRGRVEIRSPSLLYVHGDIHIEELGFLGTPKRKRAVQATFIVSGDVDIGPRARVKAALRAPVGKIRVQERARLHGSLVGRSIDIAARARLKFIPWDVPADQDPACFRLECNAVVGGTIQCVPFPTPGDACDDGNACTYADTCDTAGYCVPGSAVANPDPQDQYPCLLDSCDPTTGYTAPYGTVCDANPQCHVSLVCNGWGPGCHESLGQLPAGTPCDDGIPNNGADACGLHGQCTGEFGPYDCKANNCGTPPDPACWLDQHPGFRLRLSWPVGGQPLGYDQWPPAMQQEFHQAFTDAWDWIQNGFQNFQGTPLPEPLPNVKVLADTEPALTEFTEATARPFYFAKVAHSLALEASGNLPWSMCDYTIDMLSNLLYRPQRLQGGTTTNPNFRPNGAVVPAHPTVTYPFLADNGMIGVSTEETIYRLVDWTRRLRHHIGVMTALNAEKHWQYRGAPPVSRTIDGTCRQNAAHGLGHWTKGCGGTMAFLRDVLQAVNIPVRPLGHCGHTQVGFPTDGLYLGHGDDPYSYFKHGLSVVPPLGAILIDEPTYQAWFSGPPAPGCPEVSRRPAQLAAQFLPDELAIAHCVDLKDGKSHADSYVAQSLSPAYTVAELEAQNLWQQLDQRLVTLGLSPTWGCYLPSIYSSCTP